MAAKASEPVRTWMYRRTATGKVSSQVFDSDKIPPGWVDSPAKCVKAEKATAKAKKAPAKEAEDGGS